MAKHVYPPWHSVAQKCLFAVAVVLCITLPVIYGERGSISSTVVIVVLLLYFGLWSVFTLAVRYGLKSYTIESTLPIHTPSPAPPILLHSPPSSRHAVPTAPALRIHHHHSSRENQESPLEHAYQIKDQPPPTPIAPPSSPMHFNPPAGMTFGTAAAAASTTNGNGGGGGGGGLGVSFQTRPRGLTTDSTNSEVYPTFATYRQQQHANFDAFAQRIRRALESANASAAAAAQTQAAVLEQEKKEMELKASLGTTATTTTTRPLSTNLSPARTEGITIMGRPRSVSAASRISNLSEKIRLGSSSFFNRSRAGSDASQHQQQHRFQPPPPPGIMITNSDGGGGGGGPGGVGLPSQTTTMAAIASASAIASAMTLPNATSLSSSSSSPCTTTTTATAGRRLSTTHPLAETSVMSRTDSSSSSSSSDDRPSKDQDQETKTRIPPPPSATRQEDPLDKNNDPLSEKAPIQDANIPSLLVKPSPSDHSHARTLTEEEEDHPIQVLSSHPTQDWKTPPSS